MGKRKCRVHSIKVELIKKSQESALSAIQIFNNPLITFKSETFIALMHIAWTYLLHAYYKSKKIKYRYYDKKNKKYQKTKHGADKYWGLETCLNCKEYPVDKPIKDNLMFLIGIRHEIEHRMTGRIDDSFIGKFQACCINYNQTIKQLFGENAGLDKNISIALQLSSFNENQMDQNKNEPSLPKNVIEFISDFEAKIESKNDLCYSWKIKCKKYNENNENQADAVYKLVDEDSVEGKKIQNVIFKNVEKPKYLPKYIVNAINKKGFLGFNMYQHTTLWKANDAKILANNMESG